MRHLKILSTEDDPQVRSMLAELLIPEGHDIQFAADSNALFKIIDRQSWDILILDVNVPGKNGYQIAREICARYGERRPKMLLFTGRDTHAEKGLVLLSEVDAVLEKGVQLPLIVETIHRLTGISGERIPAGAPAAAPAQNPEPGPAPKMAALMTSSMTDPAISRGEFNRLNSRIAATVNENASLSNRLELARKRAAEIEKSIHTLKNETATLKTTTSRLSVLVLCLALSGIMAVFFLRR